MMQSAIKALATIVPKPFQARLEAVNCHHNYVEKEEHYGEEVMVTRKGAVRARLGEYGLFQVQWVRSHLLSVGLEIRNLSVHVRMVQAVL